MHNSRIELLSMCNDRNLPWLQTDSIFLYALAQIYDLAFHTLRGTTLRRSGIIDFTLRYHRDKAIKELVRIEDHNRRHAEYLSKFEEYNRSMGKSKKDANGTMQMESYSLLVDFNSIPAMI